MIHNFINFTLYNKSPNAIRLRLRVFNILLLLLLAHPRERSPDINFVIITFNYSLNLQKEYNLVTYLHFSYSTFSVANDLSNCQSTTILQTSIKKKTRVGANLSNGSLIAK